MIITLKEIQEITKNIEANICACFMFNPNLYLEYSDLNADIFKNNIWKFYFTIGKKMVFKGVKNIDEVAIETFLEGNESILEAYHNYGGFEKINFLKVLSNEKNLENMDAYIQELKKWNTVCEYIEKLTLTEEHLENIKKMNTDEFYRYSSALMNNIFIDINDDVEVSKLNEGLWDMVVKANEGLGRGMPLNSKILDAEIGGWIRGQTTIFGALSGAGKTTTTLEILVSSVWELDEPCVIMLNEQDNEKWKQQFITWIINNKLLINSDKSFNSKRWRDGHFTEEEFSLIKTAVDMLEEKKSSGKIVFVAFKSYSQKRAERIIRKYASLGVTRFVLDTFKLSSERSNNEAFWLSMQEDMRKFDDLVKPSNLNVALWCTLQLQKGSRLTRYLTGDNVGMAKNVLDVASVALLMRRLWNDEYTGERNEIEVRQPIEGTMSSRKVILDPKKLYVIIFIEKNRNGDSQRYQIVAEQNLGTLEYKEVGICDIPFDS